MLKVYPDEDCCVPVALVSFEMFQTMEERIGDIVHGEIRYVVILKERSHDLVVISHEASFLMHESI